MKIKYLGHSSFLLTASTGTAIVTDPYDSSIGYAMPQVSVDAVTVSHHHYDHDNVKPIGGNPLIFDKAQGYELPGVVINTVESCHDDKGGALRGKNVIFKFRMDGLDVCHLGDLGEKCSPELIEAILPVNVLLIPVGGNYTIDAGTAKEYVDRLKPDVVIPMHYRGKGCKLDIDKVDGFISAMEDGGVECVEKGAEIELTRGGVDGKTTKVYVMRQA